MKTSCHFIFNHLWMPTQFSDSNSPVSVLHGTNQYSLDFLDLFPLVFTNRSWQRIYNTFTVDKSSSHTLSLHRVTSTTNFPWLFPNANYLTVILGTLVYSRGTDTRHIKHVTWPLLLSDVTSNHINTCHVIPTHCCVTSPRMRCIATAHVRTRKKNFHSIVAWRMR
jgi:hypothetical protein